RRSGRRVHRGPSGPHCVGYGRSRARGFRARLRSRYCLPSGQVVSLLCGGGFGGLFAFGGRGSGFLVLGAKVLDLRLVNGGDDGVCLDEQRGTGGQDQVGGEDVVAHFAAVDVHGDLLGQVGRVGLQRNGVVVDLEDGARGNLALDVHGHVDGDLLALLHGQQERWSTVWRSAWRWMSLTRARWVWPSTSMVSRALDVRTARVVSWAGSRMCSGSAPWP